MNLFDIVGSRSMAAGVAVSAASVVVPVAFGTSENSATVDMNDGAAWLSSETAGNVVRVNGETGRVDARLDLGQIAGELLVEQGDGVVLVSFGGEVRSIDLANLDWGAATDPGVGTGLVVGDGAAYMVSLDGGVREVDPGSLEAIGEVGLEAAPAGAGVVTDGRLVLPVDDGTVRVVDGDEVAASVEAGSPGDAVHVTQVGDGVAVLNQSERTVRRLDVGSGDASDPVPVDLPSGELLVPTELPGGHLWVTATRSGELAGVHVDGEDPTATTPVADPRHALTAPVVAGDRVYLVDRTAAEIVAVDASSLEVVHREPLGVPDASKVELLVEGDKVFVNDPASEMAIVIDGDEYTRVDKYSEEGVAGNTPSETPDPGPAPSDAPAPSPAPSPEAPAPAPPAPEPPGAPATVTATPGNGSATVSWAPGGGGAATAYQVSYGRGRTIDVPGGQVSVTVDGLSNGDPYVFEVSASNEHGESAPVASNEVVPSDDVPGAPSRVVARDGDASATVEWAEADGRGNDITGYVVEASPATVEPVRVSGNDTSVEVTGLTNETAYTFTVRAINELDAQSDPSAPSNAVTPWGPPGQVSNITKAESGGTVELAWQAAAGRGPIEYVISSTPAAGGEVTTGQTGHTFEGLSNGTAYTFTIVARNERGTGPAQQVQATPGAQPTINNARAERTNPRQFRVTFDVDNGGRPVNSCTVRGGGDSANCDASGGSGSATLSVPNFNTDYTFTIEVANSMGSASATASGRSAGKSLTVESEVVRWDGACWPDSRDGKRPYYRTAAHNSCTGDIGWLNDGATVQGLCHTAGEQIQDDYENQSNQWIRIDRENGYMSTLYFENYENTNAVIDGLPAC